MSIKEIVQKLVEGYLNSEEGKKETEKLNKEALDYMIFGSPSRYLNEALLDEMNSFIKTEELSVDEMVERFGDLLTEKEIVHLTKIIRKGQL